MKSLKDLMASYSAYHRHPHNRLTHFIGVPVIMFALFFIMSYLRIVIGEVEVTFAMAFVFVVLAYYFLLDFTITTPLALVVAAMLFFAHDLSNRFTLWQGAALFFLMFVLGAFFQLLGHKIEGRKPAFLDNVFQIFAAPLFLATEVFFLLGFRQDLHRQIEEESKKF